MIGMLGMGLWGSNMFRSNVGGTRKQYFKIKVRIWLFWSASIGVLSGLIKKRCKLFCSFAFHFRILYSQKQWLFKQNFNFFTRSSNIPNIHHLKIIANLNRSYFTLIDSQNVLKPLNPIFILFTVANFIITRLLLLWLPNAEAESRFKKFMSIMSMMIPTHCNQLHFKLRKQYFMGALLKNRPAIVLVTVSCGCMFWWDFKKFLCNNKHNQSKDIVEGVRVISVWAKPGYVQDW